MSLQKQGTRGAACGKQQASSPAPRAAALEKRLRDTRREEIGPRDDGFGVIRILCPSPVISQSDWGLRWAPPSLIQSTARSTPRRLERSRAATARRWYETAMGWLHESHWRPPSSTSSRTNARSAADSTSRNQYWVSSIDSWSSRPSRAWTRSTSRCPRAAQNRSDSLWWFFATPPLAARCQRLDPRFVRSLGGHLERPSPEVAMSCAHRTNETSRLKPAHSSLIRERSSSSGSAPWRRIYCVTISSVTVPAAAHEIATRPQVPTPELLPQPPPPLEEVVRDLPLDRLHGPTLRQVRRDTQQQMHMFRSDMALQNLNVLRPTDFPNSTREALAQYHRGAPACDTSCLGRNDSADNKKEGYERLDDTRASRIVWQPPQGVA